MPRCYLCLNDRPLTRAHIVSRHFKSLFPTLADGVWNAGIRGDQETPRAAGLWHSNEFGHAPKTLCGPCNSGWAQALDHKVKAVLSDLMTLTASQVTVTEKHDLAAWATTVGLVAASESDSAWEIPERDREHLAANVAPSTHTDVWMIGIRNAPGVLAEWNAAVAGYKDRPGRDLIANIRFRQVAFQVRILSHAAQQAIPNEDFSGVMTTLWPLEFRPSGWPPSALLDDESEYRRFAARFYRGSSEQPAPNP